MVEDILKEFIDVRLDYYDRRRTFMMGELQKEIDILQIKIRFIMEFIEGKIKISNVKKVEIIEQLEAGEYLKQDDSYDYLINMKRLRF